jgi:hypothetical protein
MASFSKIKCQRLYVGSSSGIASEITSTQTGYLSGVTAGTATASKALVLGASKEIGTITTLTATTGHVTGTLNMGVDAAGTQGTIDLWPATTARGQLRIRAGLNTGDDIVTLTTGGNTSGNITVSLPIVSGTLLTQGAAAIQAGADASAGTLELWPATTNSGTLKLQVADNTFDAAIILTNADHGQSTTYTLTDAGAAAAYPISTSSNAGGLVAATVAELTQAADNSAQVMTAGTGWTSATNDVTKYSVVRHGDVIHTQILLDITDEVAYATDGDIIGASAAGAHIGQITAALNGTILGGWVTCLELPTVASTDIDFYYATENSGQPDGAVGDLTETVFLDKGGAWTAGDRTIITGFPAADSYLYVCNGAAADAGTYGGGRFLIELIGYV